jgi:hypothetical protein
MLFKRGSVMSARIAAGVALSFIVAFKVFAGQGSGAEFALTEVTVRPSAVPTSGGQSGSFIWD